MKKKIAAIILGALIVPMNITGGTVVRASSEVTTAVSSASENEAYGILKEVRENMLKLENYRIKITSETEIRGNKTTVNAEGTVDPKNNSYHMTIGSEEMSAETYMADGYRFVKEEMNADWVKTMEMGELTAAEESLIPEETAAFLDVQKNEDGSFILKTEKPVSLKELTVPSGQSNMVLPLMTGMEGTMTIEIEITPDKLIKSVTTVTESEMMGESMKMVTKAESSEFNTAGKVELPEEVKNAPESEEKGQYTEGEVTNTSTPQ